jgi:acetoin utilization protein AcuB
MIVGMWMTRDPITIEPQTALAEAAQLMSRHKIRRLPVTREVDGASRLEGILSATDLYRACPPSCNPFAPGGLERLPPELSAAQVMTRTVQTTTVDAPIEEAATAMRDRKIGALPVLNSAQSLVGVITESDIFRALVAILGDHSSGVRVTFKTAQDEDVFGFVADAARGKKVRVVSLISSRQEDCVLSVVRLTGASADAVVDELWKSGHQPLNVLRWR